MPINLLRSSRTPRMLWKYSARSLIWRVMPTVEGLFIGEERDPVSREATYFCITSRDGGVLWERQTLGDGWWTEFAGYAAGVVLLHGFATPDLPQHLKIFAVDARRGTLLWSDPSVIFTGLRGEEVHAVTPAGEPVTLALHTGERLPLRNPEAGSTGEGGQFPLQADLDGAESFLKELLDGEGQAEILDVGGYLVVGYVTRRGSGMDAPYAQEIAVIDPAKNTIVFHDRLLERTSGPSQDAFFALDGMLYYIQERRHLVCVRIPVPVS